MELTRLTLINFCQFKKLVHEYKTGVTGITGPNGHGKSNFLDPGQYFSLTGKTPDGVRKEELLRWGADKGHTELRFKDAGKRFVLTRQLASSAVKLEFLDVQEENKRGKMVNKVLTGPAVNAHIESLLKMKPELFYETCFVPQGKLWRVVMMTHAERMRYFQKITGMLKAETIRGILQEQGINKLSLYVDRSEEIEECEKEIHRLRQHRSKFHKTVTQLQEIQEGFKEALPNAQLVISLPSVGQLAAKKKEAETELSTKLAARDKFLESNELEDRAPVPEPTDANYKKREQHRSWVRDSDAWEKAASLLGKCRDELKALEKSVDIDALRKQAKESYSRNTELTVESRENLKSIKLAEEGKCPTCGKDYDGAPADDLKKRQVTLDADLQKTTEEIRRQNKQLNEYDAEYNRLSERESIHLKKTRELAEQVKELEHVASFDVEEFDKKLAQYKEYQKHLQKVAAYQEERNRLDKEVVKAEAALQAMSDKKAVTKEQRAAAQQLIDNAESLQEDLTKASVELARVDESLKNQRDKLEQYQTEMARNEKLKHVRSLFEHAREMYHRENLPKIVMSYVLVRLNRSLDRFVQFFDLPFTAEINENFDFMTHYPVRSNVPAARASGGQKVALSIAYHLAWAEALAGTVPLMVLDEPTNHLDENHKQKIREVLEKIQEVAKKGTVFMVATHDPILYPAFTRCREIDQMLVSE